MKEIDPAALDEVYERIQEPALFALWVLAEIGELDEKELAESFGWPEHHVESELENARERVKGR
jgi:DNA-directed RNA polymerase specialized sigma24 family protein